MNIGAEAVREEVHEVVLKLDSTAIGSIGVAFKVDILYGGLLGARNAPDEQLHPFPLADGPRPPFPFARRIIADAVLDGGSPGLLPDPIDCGGLYMQREAKAQAELGNSQSPEVTGQA